MINGPQGRDTIVHQSRSVFVASRRSALLVRDSVFKWIIASLFSSPLPPSPLFRGWLLLSPPLTPPLPPLCPRCRLSLFIEGVIGTTLLCSHSSAADTVTKAQAGFLSRCY